MPDPLISLARLRRQAVDEARRTLAECLELEDMADRRALTAEASIVQETEAVSSLWVGDTAVENFGAWLKQARETASASRLEQQRATAETSRAHAALVAARAAAEAVETLRAQQAAERHAAAARREQSELDEMTRHRATSTSQNPR